jgi:hypothetical protein
MSNDTILRNRPAPANCLAKSYDRKDLTFRKRRKTEIMTAIYDLDADRSGIDIVSASPAAGAGMPRAASLRDQRENPSILLDKVVRGNPGESRIAQSAESGWAVSHARIMQHEHVYAMGALIKVWTWGGEHGRDHGRILSASDAFGN